MAYFLVTKNLQHVVAEIHGVSQSSTSCCLSYFLNDKLQHLNSYLPFPTAEGELRRVCKESYAISVLPNVIGCVDRMHMPLLAPCSLSTLYRNHHG